MKQSYLSYQDLSDQILCEMCGVNPADYTVEGSDFCKTCSKTLKHTKPSKGEDDEE